MGTEVIYNVTPLAELLDESRISAWRTLRGVSRYWLVALMLSIGVSLVVDYVDVARYALGDRAVVNPPSKDTAQ